MTFPWLQPLWEQIAARVSEGRVPHALLLSGLEGSGKREFARDLAALLLCLQPEARACGACRSCKLLTGGAHPDRFEVTLEEDKAVIRVDQVRAMGDSLALTTTVSARKVVLFHPAEAMSLSAANALLKNLEEPPGDTVMLLVSHDPTRLPVTVRSRCQSLPVPLPAESQAAEWLGARTGANPTTARQALAACSGSPLRAVTMLEEGGLADFTSLQSQLLDLLSEPGKAGECAAGLADVEPVTAWRWLSLCAADAARACLAGEKGRWLGASADVLEPRVLSALQSSADRNRALAGTPVRQDLLLQEWLLEWAAQARTTA